jgi:hypothetical protein
MNTQEFISEIITPKTHKVIVYFVNETELNVLERGSTSSLYLTFGLSLFSIFCSFLIVLLSTPIKSDRIFDVFVIITSISFVSSVILLVLWRKTDDEKTSVIRCIRERFPEGERAESTDRYNIDHNN